VSGWLIWWAILAAAAVVGEARRLRQARRRRQDPERAPLIQGSCELERLTDA